LCDQIKNGEEGEKSGTCGGEERCGAYTAILLQTEGKKTLEKRRRIREDNFNVDLKNFDGIVWTGFI
jgi:hypothetical protein